MPGCFPGTAWRRNRDGSGKRDAAQGEMHMDVHFSFIVPGWHI